MIDESAIRLRFEVVAPVLDEHGRRRFAAAEAMAAGPGGVSAVMRATGRGLRLQIEVLRASTIRDIDAAFASFVQRRLDALMVPPDSLFGTRRPQILTLSARHAIPVMFGNREDVEAGGLMMYGSSTIDVYRLVGIYAGRILKGEKPADLPVQRATKFDLVINLTTARALGLTIPPNLLALADEVIE